jgi:hypothetical protein
MTETTEKPTIIKFDQVQFRDLILTIDYVTKELKNINDRLTMIEAELRLLRIEIKEK